MTLGGEKAATVPGFETLDDYPAKPVHCAML